MNVTDGDHAKAAKVAWEAAGKGNAYALVQEIATALAEEREKARAPFLALVSEYAGEALSEHFAGHTTAGDILHDIRRAAEEAS